MSIDLAPIIELLKKIPKTEWPNVISIWGDLCGLHGEDRTLVMMIADGRTEDEAKRLIAEMQSEKDIDQIIARVKDLATKGNLDEIRRNIGRLAQFTIKIREGCDYPSAFKDIYPEEKL